MKAGRGTSIGRIAARICAVVAVVCALTSGARADTIHVFAAASMGSVLAEIGAAFEGATGHKVVLSLAGTPALARQIEQGAPADMFISANPDWMTAVADSGAVVPSTRRDFLSNDLVLIAPTGAPPVSLLEADAFVDRLAGGPLAMGFVEAVPAGIYGREALTQLGLWDAVKGAVVQTDSVRAALALVALKEAPFGVVYATDVIAEPRVVEVARFPVRSHGKIVYSMALIGTKARPAATAFHAFMLSDGARAILYDAGFTPFGR